MIDDFSEAMPKQHLISRALLTGSPEGSRRARFGVLHCF